MTMLPPDPLFVIRKDLTSVMCILIMQEKDRICCGTITGEVHFSDLKTYRRKDKFKNSEESCLSLNQVPNLDDSLLVQDKTGTIRHWSSSAGNWEKLHEITVDYVGFCQARLFANMLIMPVTQGRLKLFGIPGFEEKSVIEFVGGASLGEVMTFTTFERANRKLIIVALENGLISVVDWDDGKSLSEGLKIEDCPMAIDFDSVAMRGVVGTSTSLLTIFAVSQDMAVSSYRTVQLNSEGVASICIRGDRKLFAVGCWDGRLRLLSWKTFVTLAVLDTHSQTINCVVFTSQPPYVMAAGCKEGKISLWDIYNSKL